jgi:hypothetical protein
MGKENSIKKINNSKIEDDTDDSMKRKLEKIIKQSRSENEALRKILEGLDKLNDKSNKREKK